jgi:hypothetical protein
MNACEATLRNLPYSIFKEPTTNAFNTYEPLNDGSGLARTNAISIDYFIVHAQEADRHGNVLIRGTRGLDTAYLGAAKKIIVSVEKIVDEFEITQNCIFIPWTREMTIVHSPMGAYPTSCLPDYVTDYRANKKFAEEGLNEEHLLPTESRTKFVKGAAQIDLEEIYSFIDEYKKSEGVSIQSSCRKKIGSVRTIHPIVGLILCLSDRYPKIIFPNSSNVSHPFLFLKASQAIDIGKNV